MKLKYILFAFLATAPFFTHADYQDGLLFPDQIVLHNNTAQVIKAYSDNKTYLVQPIDNHEIVLNTKGILYFTKSNMLYTLTYPVINPNMPSTTLFTQVSADIATLIWLSTHDPIGLDELTINNDTFYPARVNINQDQDNVQLEPHEKMSFHVGCEQSTPFDRTKTIAGVMKLTHNGSSISCSYPRRVAVQSHIKDIKQATLQLSTLMLMNPAKGFSIKAQPLRTISPVLARLLKEPSKL